MEQVKKPLWNYTNISTRLTSLKDQLSSLNGPLDRQDQTIQGLASNMVIPKINLWKTLGKISPHADEKFMDLNQDMM